MKKLARLSSLVLLLAVSFLAAGCTGKAPTVVAYNDFREAVSKGDYSGAFEMLSESSKARFEKNPNKLKEVLEAGGDQSLLKTAFAASSAIKNTASNGDRAQSGEIHLFDENGKTAGQAGVWALVVEGEGDTWKIDWRHAVTAADAMPKSGIPGK